MKRRKDSSEISRWWSDAFVLGRSQRGSQSFLFEVKQFSYFIYKVNIINILASILNLETGLNGAINLDTKGKRNQSIQSKNLAQRLTNPTFFEIVGWKRISFFPNALEQFVFDPDSAELKFEEVELPISIGNGQMKNIQMGSNFVYKSHSNTFLVWKFIIKFSLLKSYFRTP